MPEACPGRGALDGGEEGGPLAEQTVGVLLAHHGGRGASTAVSCTDLTVQIGQTQTRLSTYQSRHVTVRHPRGQGLVRVLLLETLLHLQHLERLGERPDIVISIPQGLDLGQLGVVVVGRKDFAQDIERTVQTVHPVPLAIVGLHSARLLELLEQRWRLDLSLGVAALLRGFLQVCHVVVINVAAPAAAVGAGGGALVAVDGGCPLLMTVSGHVRHRAEVVGFRAQGAVAVVVRCGGAEDCGVSRGGGHGGAVVRAQDGAVVRA